MVVLVPWSDSDSSENESKDEEIVNFYLMGGENSEDNDESKEVALEYLLTFSKDYLAQGLLKCVKFKQDTFLKSAWRLICLM